MRPTTATMPPASLTLAAPLAEDKPRYRYDGRPRHHHHPTPQEDDGMSPRQVHNILVEIERKQTRLVLVDALPEDGMWVLYLYDPTRGGVYRFTDYPTYREHERMGRRRRPVDTPSTTPTTTFDIPYAGQDGGLSLAEVREVFERSLSAVTWSVDAIHRISTTLDDERHMVRFGVTTWLDVVTYGAYLAVIAPLDTRATPPPRAHTRAKRPVTDSTS